MASFFKKALGVFVEFDEEKKKEESPETFKTVPSNQESTIPRTQLNHAEAEKFEKYFDQLFDKANLPGPDYYEFFKTMDTLEAHIHDEKARLSATFASLSIQGLTKETLLNTAAQYKVIMEKDRANFEKALADKLKSDVGQKAVEVQTFEKKIAANADLIQKLTKEISDAQALIGKLKTEITEEENKLSINKTGYMVACSAVINKITTDIQKIQTTL
ncbi:MAG: hypothetical protein IAF38_18425 [Bacteroidia bacterium]|nr:hypothetical protein [Bacteroidia bacterium]